jgi:hypothetical protein
MGDIIMPVKIVMAASTKRSPRRLVDPWNSAGAARARGPVANRANGPI